MGAKGFTRNISLLLCFWLSGCDVTSDSTKKPGEQAQEPDPAAVDFPVAYVARPVPIADEGGYVANNLLEPTAFQPGARLIVKARAEGPAAEIDITSGVFTDQQSAEYDVKDLEVSPDGSKLIFAMRAPEDPDADADKQPTWNIWEYDHGSGDLRRIIQSDTLAEQGQDVAPSYLADGRIVFSSTRQRRSRALLLDENKPQYAGLTEDLQQEALVLHVMDADGGNIQQITFNHSHDLHPTLLNDGRIVFLRWDNAARRNRLSLYTVNPDGSELAILYGYHSQNTGSGESDGAFADPKLLPDGRLLVNLRPRESERWGGDLVAIDTANFIDNNQPTADNAGATGPAQESQTALPVLTDGQLSRHGHFNAAAPLFDGTDRMFVSWSQCRVIHPDTGRPTFCSEQLLDTPDIQEAPPLYSLWIYDSSRETQLPVVPATEGVMYTDPAVLAPRPLPAYDIERDFNSELAEQNLGVLHIRSVYDFAGQDTTANGITNMADPNYHPARTRPARFLRIYKPVPIPDDEVRDFDTSAFGLSNRHLMREIIGYVPIEPDGSVKFTVPADTAFSIAVLDSRGHRTDDGHHNWLTLRPGEEVNCNGCHTEDSELPHGRPDAEFPSANPGAPVTGVPFRNTQLLDADGNPAPPPQMGESMAEYYSRVRGARTPSMDIEFVDEWPEEADSRASSFSYSYAAIAEEHNALAENCPELPEEDQPTPWQAPAENCDAENWTSQCRTRIHYPTAIQPLWEADRRQCDANGNLEQDNTCTSCHNSRDAMEQAQVPAGQLELTARASDTNNLRITSYQELLFGDTEDLVDEEGNLVERVDYEPTGEYETDADGNPILDENGDPIPILEPITYPVAPPLSLGGAQASGGFFRLFDGRTEDLVHNGLLSDSELKLLAEWLDIGGQYYNDPFAAPAD